MAAEETIEREKNEYTIVVSGLFYFLTQNWGQDENTHLQNVSVMTISTTPWNQQSVQTVGQRGHESSVFGKHSHSISTLGKLKEMDELYDDKSGHKPLMLP